MNKFIISTDSNCDLPAELCEKYNVPILSLNYCFDNIIYGSENQMSTKKFYERLRNGEKPTTMAVNTEDAKDRFKELIKEGWDIIHISFSSALSCTYQNVCLAADELKEEHPSAQVTVIDSLCASLGQGLLVYKAIMYMQNNHTYKEVIDYVEHIKLNISHRFTVDSLEHLHRGGRISKSASIIGSLINIKPLLYVNDSGALVPTGKIRGRKKSLLELANLLINAVKNSDMDNSTVAISHGDCPQDAGFLADVIKDATGVSDIIINHINPAIASHSGPGTVAVFFEAPKR